MGRARDDDGYIYGVRHHRDQSVTSKTEWRGKREPAEEWIVEKGGEYTPRGEFAMRRYPLSLVRHDPCGDRWEEVFPETIGLAWSMPVARRG